MLTRKKPLQATKPMPRVRKSPREKGAAYNVARELGLLRPLGEKPPRADDDKAYIKACHGEPCYLAIPGTCRGALDTVVACHSNELRAGKGRGIKALNIYTVPGCFHCHTAIDSGKDLSRVERQAIWRSAYARWEPAREQKMLSS